MSLLDSFLYRAVLAGIGAALAAGPLGCFVIWRRMAFYGDATAHAAILGVALSLAFSMSIFVGTLAVALSMAVGLTMLSGRVYGTDTLLGVLAHSALAIGLVAVSLMNNVRIDLMSYLFGDILAVGRVDLVVIWAGTIAVLALLAWRWTPLLTATLNPDLAQASGIDPKREELILTLALAITVAVALKVVGALLISALLIIPTAAARPFATTPERMALLASGLGVAAVLGGLGVSYQFDTPAGPSIVCLAALLFVVANLSRAVMRAD